MVFQLSSFQIHVYLSDRQQPAEKGGSEPDLQIVSVHNARSEEQIRVVLEAERGFYLNFNFCDISYTIPQF